MKIFSLLPKSLRKVLKEVTHLEVPYFACNLPPVIRAGVLGRFTRTGEIW